MNLNLNELMGVLCRYHKMLGLLDEFYRVGGDDDICFHAEYLRVSGFVGEVENVVDSFGEVVRVEKLTE